MTEMSSLNDYLALVRRRKWIILQAVVLIPALAVVLSLQQEPVYESSAEVYLSRQNLAAPLAGLPDQTAFQDPVRFGQTQADLARAPELLERTVEAAGAPLTPGQLLADSGVRPKGDADFLVFTVRSGERALATELANVYAREFTLYRRDFDTQVLRGARVQLGERIQELEAGGLGPESDLYTSLVDREQQLRTFEALQTSNTYVVRPASGANQIEPRPQRNGVLGLLLGLVLGHGLAFLWNALDRRVRSEKEIERALGIPLAARLPAPSRQLRRSGSLAMLAEPSGRDAEMYRTLRTSFEFLSLGSPMQTIMVTSAAEGEGKSTTIANLAVAFARTGRRTVLVDLDLRRPALARLLDLPQRPGITDVVLGHVPLESALRRIPLTGESPVRARGNGGRAVAGFLEVLPSGTIPPDPGDLVRTAALAEVLDRLKARADVIVVDAPPLLAVGDTLALSSQVDGLLVVTSFPRVTRPILSELARLLAMSSARPIGFVMTGTRRAQTYGHPYDVYAAEAADVEAPEPARKVAD
jgi:polysaccharide biosynthesis transport protein